jgi:hypothetical protein
MFQVIDNTIVKDELDTNTPMWWALRDAQFKNCQTTIQKECTKMFWLGYFLKKRMQDENHQKIFAANRGELEKWLIDHELRNYYFINQAKLIKKNYYLGLNQQRLDEAAAFKAKIKEELAAYVVEETVSVILYNKPVAPPAEGF